jgi:quercetin dioxygenase-like cupin family protein
MNASYALVSDLYAAIDAPLDGTLSRTLHQDDHVKVVLFGFGAGQELSEHTASMPAMMHFLRGDAEVGLGADTIDATAGTWVHMPAGLPHRIRAKTPVTMLLTLLKHAKQA